MLRGPFFVLMPGVLIAGVVLGGCAGPTTGNESPEPDAAPSKPACEEIWVDGQNLPEEYDGCAVDGTWVEAEIRRCDSGQILVTYADRYYGAKGFRVNDMGGSLRESPLYQRALRSCG